VTDQANEYLKAVSSETLANFEAIASTAREPAICRVQALDDEGERQT